VEQGFRRPFRDLTTIWRPFDLGLAGVRRGPRSRLVTAVDEVCARLGRDAGLARLEECSLHHVLKARFAMDPLLARPRMGVSSRCSCLLMVSGWLGVLGLGSFCWGFGFVGGVVWLRRGMVWRCVGVVGCLCLWSDFWVVLVVFLWGGWGFVWGVGVGGLLGVVLLLCVGVWWRVGWVVWIVCISGLGGVCGSICVGDGVVAGVGFLFFVGGWVWWWLGWAAFFFAAGSVGVVGWGLGWWWWVLGWCVVWWICFCVGGGFGGGRCVVWGVLLGFGGCCGLGFLYGVWCGGGWVGWGEGVRLGVWFEWCVCGLWVWWVG